MINKISSLLFALLIVAAPMETNAQFKFIGRIFSGDSENKEATADNVSNESLDEASDDDVFPSKEVSDEDLKKMQEELLRANYRIASGDVINIDVFQEETLSKENLRVSASGQVTLPLLQRITVAELTVDEAESRIEELLNKDYLVDPHVIVTVVEYTRRTVAVDGEVAKPGLIDLPPGQKLTVIQAIAASGGLTQDANRNDIELYREGEEEPFKFRLNDLKRQTNPEKKFYVKPNDTIFVGARII